MNCPRVIPERLSRNKKYLNKVCRLFGHGSNRTPDKCQCYIFRALYCRPVQPVAETFEIERLGTLSMAKLRYQTKTITKSL